MPYSEAPYDIVAPLDLKAHGQRRRPRLHADRGDFFSKWTSFIVMTEPGRAMLPANEAAGSHAIQASVIAIEKQLPMIEVATCNEAGSNSVGLNTHVRMQLSDIGQVESKGPSQSCRSDATPARFLLADGFAKSANLCAIYIRKLMGVDPKMALMLKWAGQPHIDATRLLRCEAFPSLQPTLPAFSIANQVLRASCRTTLGNRSGGSNLQDRFDVSVNLEEVRRLDFCKSNLKVLVTLTEPDP